MRKRLGVALGSGGARGSAHVGVLRVLEENGLRPDVIVGSSMGAQVGGLYAAGVGVDRLSELWRSMNKGKMVRALLPTVPWGGWSSGAEVVRTVRSLVGDRRIEDLPTDYAAVATDLQSGGPYPIRKGPLYQAIRASISVPGLFTPVWLDGHLLIDGGVSDPVPVDVARALGAEVVVAVDVLVSPEEARLSGIPSPLFGNRPLGITPSLEAAQTRERAASRFHPSVFAVLFQMSTIFQKRVCEMSLKACPPDVLLRPDFTSAPPCYSAVRCGIEAGEEAARRALPEIARLVGGA
jgi:NTE family protein